ncbi:hypothetical protein GH714_009731 [Hevea brasiliensis]|uniref:Uncharacterized protein n=1 Tax=Hevea brasiliensis TaxID=3981 RepID=A0A6A6MHI9_HEVBR|nr:hypothetical protein GH714_009731 [Hevea brasiliensis]
MGFLLSFSLITLLSLASIRNEAQGIKSARLLDLVIRDYTFKSYDINNKTGIIHTVHLPANFSGIEVDTVKFRCGSLRRYGAQVKEFHLGIGVIVEPCVQRVMVIRQNLGHNWSSIYYACFDLSGYQLVSPILGLLAYNDGSDVNFSNPVELGIHAGEKPITIDFTNATSIAHPSGIRPLCASFENDGKVKLKTPASHNICVVTRRGHYGLVIESPPPSAGAPGQARKKISLWKVWWGARLGLPWAYSFWVCFWWQCLLMQRRKQKWRRWKEEPTKRKLCKCQWLAM